MKTMGFFNTVKWLSALLLALMLALPTAGHCEPSGLLEVYFMDLGRVDGILIRCGGAVSFIDVGFHSDAKLATRWLNAMGITHLDSYIGTHGHYDHIEGAPDMIEALRPDTVYVSHVGCLSAIPECATEAQQAVIAETNKVILLPGDTFAVGPATVTCLGPPEILRCHTGGTDENENSLILRLDYGQRRLLFTGDTTDEVLRSIERQNPGTLKADVLKNPHHNGSHDADVIDLIAPDWVVFCTDDDNPVRESYAELLAERNIHALCLGSANQGNVGIVTDGREMEIRCGTAVDAVALSPAPDMAPGQTLTLFAAVDPDGALMSPRQLGWNSSDEHIARVDGGVVRAVAPGTVTIKAAALNGASASLQLRVMEVCPVLEKTAIGIAMGETEVVKSQILPGSARDRAIEWLSEDESVATVSDGAVTGVGEGETRVLARLSNGAQTWCRVTVKGQLAHSVRLTPAKASLRVGETLTLAAAVEPTDYDLDNLEWRSSDEGVLWVDGYGTVTAVRKGKAQIAVVASEGVYDVCTIRVSN